MLTNEQKLDLWNADHQRDYHKERKMDKQLIERAAIAAMCAVSTSGQMGDASDDELSAIANMNEKDKALTVALFSDFLARIDTERGKEAVGFASRDMGAAVMVSAYAMQPGSPHPHFIIPLFLSPTIPEGMALVPIEEIQSAADFMKIVSLASMRIGDDRVYRDQLVEKFETIAAAQGERK